MIERVGNEQIEREPGYIYYLGKDGYVWRSPRKFNIDGTKKRIGTVHIERDNDYVYFVTREGYVCRAMRAGMR